jgi:hypothetical protein
MRLKSIIAEPNERTCGAVVPSRKSPASPGVSAKYHCAMPKALAALLLRQLSRNSATNSIWWSYASRAECRPQYYEPHAGWLG